MTEEVLDLKNTPCPVNYIRSKMKLETMPAAARLRVLLRDLEALNSVAQSISTDGYQIIDKIEASEHTELVIVNL